MRVPPPRRSVVTRRRERGDSGPLRLGCPSCGKSVDARLPIAGGELGISWLLKPPDVAQRALLLRNGPSESQGHSHTLSTSCIGPPLLQGRTQSSDRAHADSVTNGTQNPHRPDCDPRASMGV